MKKIVLKTVLLLTLCNSVGLTGTIINVSLKKKIKLLALDTKRIINKFIFLNAVNYIDKEKLLCITQDAITSDTDHQKTVNALLKILLLKGMKLIPCNPNQMIVLNQMQGTFLSKTNNRFTGIFTDDIFQCIVLAIKGNNGVGLIHLDNHVPLSETQRFITTYFNTKESLQILLMTSKKTRFASNLEPQKTYENEHTKSKFIIDDQDSRIRKTKQYIKEIVPDAQVFTIAIGDSSHRKNLGILKDGTLFQKTKYTTSIENKDKVQIKLENAANFFYESFDRQKTIASVTVYNVKRDIKQLDMFNADGIKKGNDFNNIFPIFLPKK